MLTSILLGTAIARASAPKQIQGGVTEGPTAIFAKLPFPGGTVQQLLEYRKERSGRGNFVGRIDAVAGVGPWRLIDEKGQYGTIGNQFWTLTLNQEQAKSERVYSDPAKSSVTMQSHPIDTFTPQVLVPADYLGIVMSVPKDEPVKTKLLRQPSARIFSLTGQFRLKELENFGFEKKVAYPGMFANHIFVTSVSTVTDRAFLKSVAAAGGYLFEETNLEFVIKFDPKRTLGLVNRSREFYALDSPNSLLGARLILKHKVLPTLSEADIEKLATVDRLEFEIPSNSPLIADINRVVQITTAGRPELAARLKPGGIVKLSIYGYCNVSARLEMENGRFWSF